MDIKYITTNAMITNIIELRTPVQEPVENFCDSLLLSSILFSFYFRNIVQMYTELITSEIPTTITPYFINCINLIG